MGVVTPLLWHPPTVLTLDTKEVILQAAKYVSGGNGQATLKVGLEESMSC